MEKVKITVRPWDWECGDGCFSEHGVIYKVDGVEVSNTPNPEQALNEILTHLGIKNEVCFVDENEEDVCGYGEN
jgi:hypothetical protein